MANVQLNVVLALIGTEHPAWFAELRKQSDPLRWATATTAEEVWRMVQHRSQTAQAVMAVVGYHSVVLDECFAMLRNQGDQCPLLIGVGPHPVSSDDLSLPPHPDYLPYLLQAFLRGRAESDHLKADKMRLTQDLLTKQGLSHRDTSEVLLLKNAIVRNVSHELRTPLLQVKSAVALLADSLENSTLVTYAQNATARLEGVVKNILQLGESLEALTQETVIVRELFDLTQRNLSRSWEHRDHVARVTFQTDQPLPTVLGNRQGLAIVLQHLLSNALKFSEGAVLVRAWREGDQVLLSVKDSGIGIPAEQQKAMFEPFVQLDASATRRYGGLGVGLSIVRLILDKLSISFTLNSVSGQGTEFMLHLKPIEFKTSGRDDTAPRRISS
jgi:signal transduction histidine kinase